MAAMIDKDMLTRRFGRTASVYESVTPVQASMGGRLLDLACKALGRRDIRHVLELGCGTGRLTRKLINTFPEARIIAVDICPEMVTQAAYKLKHDRLELFVADAEEIADEGEGIYDLIISNATIQWFTRPEEVLPAYHKRLKPDGCLALSSFGPDTFRELQAAFVHAYMQASEPAEPHVIDLLTARQFSSLLPGAEVLEEYRIEEFEDVRGFLKSVQRAGAAYQPEAAHTLSRKVYGLMTEYYLENFKTETDRIRATYHLLYILAGEGKLNPIPID